MQSGLPVGGDLSVSYGAYRVAVYVREPFKVERFAKKNAVTV